MVDLNVAAAQYGVTIALFNSDGELKSLLERAVAGNYDGARFQTELRNTNWFRTNGEAARTALSLKNDDPATWAQRQTTTASSIRAVAAEMGAVIDDGIANQLADTALTMGWNDTQLRQGMRQYVQYSNGQLHGQAQANENQIWAYADAMGITVSAEQMQQWAGDAAAGLTSMNSVLGAIQNQAESQYPWLMDRFNNGETYESIAQPYKQTMAALLEMSPSQITSKDETIKRAISHKGNDGQYNLRSIWEFENDLRNDKRWASTQNAQDAGMAIVNGLGKMFGKIS